MGVQLTILEGDGRVLSIDLDQDSLPPNIFSRDEADSAANEPARHVFLQQSFEDTCRGLFVSRYFCSHNSNNLSWNVRAALYVDRASCLVSARRLFACRENNASQKTGNQVSRVANRPESSSVSWAVAAVQLLGCWRCLPVLVGVSPFFCRSNKIILIIGQNHPTFVVIIIRDWPINAYEVSYYFRWPLRVINASEPPKDTRTSKTNASSQHRRAPAGGKRANTRAH